MSNPVQVSAAESAISCLLQIASGSLADPSDLAREALLSLGVPHTTVRVVERGGASWVTRPLSWVGVFSTRGVWVSDQPERWGGAPNFERWLDRNGGPLVRVVDSNDTEHLVRVSKRMLVVTER